MALLVGVRYCASGRRSSSGSDRRWKREVGSRSGASEASAQAKCAKPLHGPGSLRLMASHTAMGTFSRIDCPHQPGA